MSNGVTFTPEAAKRIARVVKRVEQTPTQFGGRNPSSALTASEPFFVRLLDPYTREEFADGHAEYYLLGSGAMSSNTQVFYSWEAVVPTKYGHLAADPQVQGVASARPLNAKGQSELIEYGTIVQLHLVGFDDDGVTPLYVFVDGREVIGQMFVPPHDHRSNTPGYGGFAFACYAPGTSLPQMPWAI